MQLTWYGHAAFEIETRGTRVLTDPYSSQIGYAPINAAPDIVTFSHENPRYHSCLDELRHPFEVVDGLQLAQEKRTVRQHGITFGALEVFEDAEGNGPNAMVWLEAEGLRVLHMGDCGHPLTQEHLKACGKVDVLLAPAGGAPTIAVTDLAHFVRQLRPRLVIPMHYALPQLKTLNLRPVGDFTNLFPATLVERAPQPTVTLTQELRALQTKVLIMPPAR